MAWLLLLIAVSGSFVVTDMICSHAESNGIRSTRERDVTRATDEEIDIGW